MDWYQPLKLVHVLSAIVAVGTNVTYFVGLAVMKGRAPTQQAFALETIKKLDARLANPAYGILPLTGVIMVLISDGLGFTTFWIAVAIGLYVLVGVLAGVFFAPALRRQTELAGEAGSAAYDAAARRTSTTGLLTMLPVAGILYLMVLKPVP
ncbi:MAG: DUF2269 family protein [Actinomycetota bacterium]